MSAKTVTERVKPAKPYPTFPLTPHASGKWVKRIAGRSVYFGTWDDPDGALREYLAATSTEQTSKTLTVADGVNMFLHSKKLQANRGEVANRSFLEYVSTGRMLTRHFGRDFPIAALSPARFSEYRQSRGSVRNLVSLGNEVQRIRTIFGWLAKNKHIAAVEFGSDFRKPSALQRRRHKRTQGAKTFDPIKLRWIISESGLQLGAMILLGVNCGYYPSDCARLRPEHIDGDWLAVPRWKTEEDREAWLWPETLAAIDAWLQSGLRPASSQTLFCRVNGDSWEDSSNLVSKHFRQALGRCGMRSGAFSWLRHTCETIGGGCKDQVAVNRVMGHVDASMAGVYRHGFDRDRIVAVCGHVREWLYGR